VQRSIQGIGRLRDTMSQSSTVMKEMGKRTSEITRSSTPSTVIAERTNLLSLNASIEAAAPATLGAVFAVVAEEIRNLADRSPRRPSDIAAHHQGLQDVAQEALTASSESLRIADDSNAVAETGAGRPAQDSQGIGETVDFVGQIARATEEQRTAGRTSPSAVAATADQAALVATATAQQATGSATLVQSTANAEDCPEGDESGPPSSSRLPRHHESVAEYRPAGGRCPAGDLRTDRRDGADDPGDRRAAARRGHDITRAGGTGRGK
jgi:methyl-accepting chemotaxis protein